MEFKGKWLGSFASLEFCLGSDCLYQFIEFNSLFLTCLITVIDIQGVQNNITNKDEFTNRAQIALRLYDLCIPQGGELK